MTTLPPKRPTAKKKRWPYIVLGTILIFVLAALAGVFFAQSSLLDRNKADDVKLKTSFLSLGVAYLF